MSRPYRFESKRTKAAPTTIRLEIELDRWVREEAEAHAKGQTGVINDAVRYYKHIMAEQGHLIFQTIVEANGQKTENPR